MTSSTSSNSKPNYLALFKKLGKYEDGFTRIVSMDECKGEYEKLIPDNGGGWCRFDVIGKHHKIFTVNTSGKIRYSSNINDEEKINIDKEVDSYMKERGSSFKNGKKNKLYLIQLYGLNVIESSRYIRKDIRDHFKNKSCVVCGTSQIEIDHKNGLYNDSRVQNSTTQTFDDFQPLCKHCNDQKRQTYLYSKKTGKRYPATMIPQLKPFGIDFVVGDETYDPNDINAMVGTYWYDPVYFMEKVIDLRK